MFGGEDQEDGRCDDGQINTRMKVEVEDVNTKMDISACSCFQPTAKPRSTWNAHPDAGDTPFKDELLTRLQMQLFIKLIIEERLTERRRRAGSSSSPFYNQ